MKQLFIECNMGIAGDMLCGALIDTLPADEQKQILSKLNTLLDGVRVNIKRAEKCGISGIKFDVNVTCCGNSHTKISEIYDIIDSFDIDEKTKADAKSVYTLIADAESKVHGIEVADVHLHEVGAKDAIMDITAACYMINYLGIKRIISTPVVTGYGRVSSAHGIITVPAPATVEILKGMKIKTGGIEGELCTPTGAALIKYFAEDITDSVEMIPLSVGYGMGTKNFERANCVRVVVADADDEIYELRCQLDDMTGEEMGYAINKLMSLGALDVFCQSIVMKKSRPAYALTVITTIDKKDYFTAQLFRHTTTLGVRQVKCVRKSLDRDIVESGAVHIKKSSGYGTCKQKTEFDDLVKMAENDNISIFEAKQKYSS